jgi:hypothetical protein
MVSYYYGGKGDKGFGTQYVEDDIFPSVRKISEMVGSDIIILSAFEFKNKQDFEDAQR